jgi:hypothetical protein
MFSSFLTLLLGALVTHVTASTGYHERLLLRPLPQGTLLASFNFVSNETQTAFTQQKFSAGGGMPKAGDRGRGMAQEKEAPAWSCGPG